MNRLQEALETIKNNKVYAVGVNLHLHYDQDDTYDFTGENVINVSVKVKEFDQLSNCERFMIRQFPIDLEGVSVEECKKKHTEVFEIVHNQYEASTKREYIHR